MTDRAAIMRAAWKEWRYARMKGWDKIEDDTRTWPRCLRFAAAQHRERQKSWPTVEAAMREVLVASDARSM
jgi:hypothetical protein